MTTEYYRYIIWPEFDGLASYAWLSKTGEDGPGVGCCVGSATGWYGHIPISDQLQTDFAAWAIEFEKEVDAFSEDYDSVDWNHFHEQGIKLAIRLKAEFGGGSRVIYVKPHEESNGGLEKYREILDDGSLQNYSPTNECL